MDDTTTIKAIVVSIVEKEVSKEMDISFDVRFFKDKTDCIKEFGIDRRNFIFMDSRIGLGNTVFVFNFEKPVGELHGIDRLDCHTHIPPRRTKPYGFDDPEKLKEELHDVRNQLSIERTKRAQFQHQLNEANECNRILRRAFELILDNIGNLDC